MKSSINRLVVSFFILAFVVGGQTFWGTGTCLQARPPLPIPRRQVPEVIPEIRGNVSVVQLDETNICLVGSYQNFIQDRFEKECGPFLKLLATPEYRPQDWSYRFHYNFAAAEVVEAYRPLIAHSYQAVDRISVTDSQGKKAFIRRGGYWLNPVSAMHLPDQATGEDQIVRSAEVLHFTYLELEKPLKNGEQYTVKNALGETTRFRFGTQNRSDAIKVNQVGYAAYAGRKYAYLGTWRGPELKARDYSDWTNRPFQLVDLKTGSQAFAGTIQKRVVSDEIAAFSGEQVWEMDFSAFCQPGEYKIVVDGIGSSWPFKIGNDAIGEAFYVRARGMYHKRCGCLKEEPYTAWTAERGVRRVEKSSKIETKDETKGSDRSNKAEKIDRTGVTNRTEKEENTRQKSVCHAQTYQGQFPPNWRHYGTRGESGFFDESGNKCEVKTFDLIHETQDSAKLIPGVFGGWHDAADYDRRSLHLQSIGDFAAAYLMFPDNFTDGQLNIPESGNGIPDILDEAVWGAMVWLRAQNEQGGVGCWIEADSHPANYLPETDEQRYYLALPTMESSADYAGYAAELALALKQAGANELSKTFQKSAEKAYRYGSDVKNRLVKKYQNIPVRVNGKIEKKNLEYRESEKLSGAQLGKAAFNLFWLTGDKRYLDDFAKFRPLGIDKYMKDLNWDGSPMYWAELTVWRDPSSQFRKKLVPAGQISSDSSSNLRDFLETYQEFQKQTILLAETRLQELNENYQYRMPWYAPGHAYVSHTSWGNFQPLNRARPFIVAWRLTGDTKYRDAALLCNDWQLGTNPTNSSMTSGLGKNYPVRFLDLPSYSDGIEEFVPGITPYRNTFGLARPAVEIAWGLYYEERRDHDFKGTQISLLPQSLVPLGKTIDINDYAKTVAGAIPVLRRFANVEGWSVAASEYTVWETIAPQAAITGCLLEPGWRPSEILKNRKPVKNLDLLPGKKALP